MRRIEKFYDDFKTDVNKIESKLQERRLDYDVFLNNIWQQLIDSEKKMVTVFNAEDKKQVPDVSGMPGSAQFGMTLYILNNLPKKFNRIGKILKKLGMPKSTITDDQWASYLTRIHGEGYYGEDGSLYQGQVSIDYLRKYVQLDPGWGLAFFEYIVHLEDFLHLHPRAEFNTNPAKVPISTKEHNQLKIAVFGDWGTGAWVDGNQPMSPSQLVMEQINSMDPDVIIHLGDVYYAGTQGLKGYGQEKRNFIDQWKRGSAKWCFTLNSNHEMYDGGNGYFKTALDNKVFKYQNKTSYFSIDYGSWLILGLDSAYYDKSGLYLKGALYDEKIKKSLLQKEFIKKASETAEQKGQQIIVMTHHNPLETDGTLDSDNLLWNQMAETLGSQSDPRYPDYWYWGHIHNGMVYTNKSGAGDKVKCRCSGHASIPFANSFALDLALKNGVVAYYAHTPMTGSSKYPLVESQKLRMLNGFAIITLSADSIIEEFFETGSNEPVWSNI